MGNTISDIAKELETLYVNPPYLGVKNNGLTGISLFFFYYARFTGDERYMELANDALERIVNSAPYYMSYSFASNLADLGRIIDLLASEKFTEVEAGEFTEYFDAPLMRRLRKDIGIDFGFCTGTIGICDFFLKLEKMSISFPQKELVCH
jgi:lantibiotic modifying enzyme